MRRNFILVVVIVLLAIAGWYAYTRYTGKVKSLTSVAADVHIGAPELIAAFERDSATANKQYLGKVVAVNGTVRAVENEGGSATVVLGSAGTMSSVRCSMDSAFVQQAATLQKGAAVTIKGNCTGFTTDELVGSDVILNRCVLDQNKP